MYNYTKMCSSDNNNTLVAAIAIVHAPRAMGGTINKLSVAQIMQPTVKRQAYRQIGPHVTCKDSSLWPDRREHPHNDHA